MKKHLLLTAPLLVAAMTQVMAQTRAVSGRITDRATGEGLPGVTVLVKGTTTGVSTNSDGSFTLNVPAGATTLSVSSVGFITQEVQLGNETSFNIGIAADTKTLSEVVVTGYGGSQDVKDITGSVATIKADKFLNQPVSSLDQALTGRAAGVQVTSTGGTLGDGVAVRIRGANSISGSSQPLYVVDGVPVSTRENANVFNGGNGTRYNPLADINPNDIESVDVLKDASASAIYGSRAANGVIIITTKRGKAGKNNISLNSYVGWNEPVRLPKLLNGDDFNAIQNEKAFNRYGAGTANSVIARDIDLNGDGQADRTDWLKEVFRTGFSQNYQVALSGGNDKASYYGSGDYSDQNGIINTNRLRRGSVRLNLDITPKKWLKAGVSANYAQSQNNGVLTDGYLAGATVSGFNAAPNVPVYGTDGQYYLNAAGNLGSGNNTTTAAFIANNVSHPLAVLELNRNANTSRRLLSNGYVEIQPIQGLRITSKYGVDYLDNFEDQYSDSRLSGLGRSYGGLVQNNRLDRTQWNWQNYANYNKTFAEKHTVTATAGLEYQETQEKQVYTGAPGLADPKFNTILDGLFSGTPFAGGTAFGNAFRSVFGLASYDYANKYYVQFALRADEDSRFGAENRRGVFPAVSAGWRISEEAFMQNYEFVSNLKLRGSYGLVGNSNGIGSYASRNLAGGAQYTELNGFGISQIGNNEIKWETSRKLDVGLDVGFLQNRVNLVFDFFNTNISGLLLAAPIPTQFGVPGGSIFRNVGSMYNRGVEASLSTTNIETESGFRWVSSINGTVIKNRVTGLNDPADLPGGVQVASIGRSLGVYKLVRWAGVNPANGNAQFLTASGEVKQYDPVVGAYRNTSGDLTTPITQADAVYTKAGGYPTYYGGFDNTFSFKGIELGVFLQFSGGNKIYNSSRAQLMTNLYNNNIEEIKERWTTPGQETDVPRLYLADNLPNQASTRWLENGDFLRLRQINLGYNLPKGLYERFGLNNLRVYGQVQNAFVITNYKGIDPEVNSNRNNSNIAFGVDNRSVPQPRSYTLGLNISL
ncbi:TonB-dependent receptor [Hymenobacter endophyticus]|uniref:TonB-dependent receptor n=1 Tax=Hymenobacter endophyticus TaxID=3076335 RepID=A0ABU3TI88_9BACT|nr:TonB-dependent receptor [Hymenobacter endophyticus]MDU0371067.1 TonB-dependent receptor [Hymenobacter endophyticus]